MSFDSNEDFFTERAYAKGKRAGRLDALRWARELVRRRAIRVRPLTNDIDAEIARIERDQDR